MNEALGFVWTALSLAAHAIRQRPARSLLTAFGILVGIAAVTIVVSIAEGASAVVTGAVDALGTNALMIVPKPAPKSGLRDVDRPSLLDDDDAAALGTDAPSVAVSAPVIGSVQQIVAGNTNASSRVMGTTRAFFVVRDWKVSRGAIWSPSAETTRERVCVIGETVRSELFGPEDPVGRLVRIGRFPFKVIGLLDKKGQNPFGNDEDDVVITPLTTLRTKVVRLRPGRVHFILASAVNADAVETAQREITSILRQRHEIREEAPSDFDVRTQAEFRKTQGEIVGVLELLFLAIGAVSLVVGGIGVMNIMLVSVAERTREIGIRLAIGARSADILAQFLIEAVSLSVLGGASGALAAALGVTLLRGVMDLPMRVSWVALAVAIGTSTVIGVIFGFFPARRAAKLDPIVALRTD
jgi:putative ABC transport system permease protein